MHSIYARFNNFTAFLSSCVMALLAAIALSSFVFPADPKGEVSLTSIKVFPGSSRRLPDVKQEFAFVNFNITADLTPLFHWNTKQLFLYLQAEYVDSKSVRNEVVIWDSIIRRREDAAISVMGRSKYVFRDLSRSFRKAQAANYTLRYNLMPYVGVLEYGEAGRTSGAVAFPEGETVS